MIATISFVSVFSALKTWCLAKEATSSHTGMQSCHYIVTYQTFSQHSAHKHTHRRAHATYLRICMSRSQVPGTSIGAHADLVEKPMRQSCGVTKLVSVLEGMENAKCGFPSNGGPEKCGLALALRILHFRCSLRSLWSENAHSELTKPMLLWKPS